MRVRGAVPRRLDSLHWTVPVGLPMKGDSPASHVAPAFPWGLPPAGILEETRLGKMKSKRSSATLGVP